MLEKQASKAIRRYTESALLVLTFFFLSFSSQGRKKIGSVFTFLILFLCAISHRSR